MSINMYTCERQVSISMYTCEKCVLSITLVPVLRKRTLWASRRILEVSKDRDATNNVIRVPPEDANDLDK